jgi:hypothetical protein
MSCAPWRIRSLITHGGHDVDVDAESRFEARCDMKALFRCFRVLVLTSMFFFNLSHAEVLFAQSGGCYSFQEEESCCPTEPVGEPGTCSTHNCITIADVPTGPGNNQVSYVWLNCSGGNNCPEHTSSPQDSYNANCCGSYGTACRSSDDCCGGMNCGQTSNTGICGACSADWGDCRSDSDCCSDEDVCFEGFCWPNY